MQFLDFRVRNFKGIENAKIDLIPSGANIFTLIGLNESGKTTLLEAISKIQTDVEEQMNQLFESDSENLIRNTYIPKHMKANFTGSISIITHIKFDDGEKALAIGEVEEEFNCKIDSDSVPDVISLEKRFDYEDSEFKPGKYVHFMDMFPRVRVGNERKFSQIGSDSPIWQALANQVHRRRPRVLYFPTFLFSFPERILLNPSEAEDPINAIYRKIIEDVAAASPGKFDIQKHIVQRIIGQAKQGATGGAEALRALDRQQQVAAVLDEMSLHMSEVIFGEWEEVLGDKNTGMSFVLRHSFEASAEGEVSVFISINVSDGRATFNVNERSLGFRWFFSFLLFTLYRAKAKSRGAVLFLLDEPAANLHPKAQMQLLDSFAKIAGPQSSIMYSTHSHYMVNPAWLEQAYIIANSAAEIAEQSERGGRFLTSVPKITVQRYRQFVGQNPDKMTYFQPVLDRLDVVPSRLDVLRPCLIFEGKGDFAIVEYVRAVILGGGAEMTLVPTRGASGMDEIIGLLSGWGVSFCICLDDDKEGRLARERYRSEWGLSAKKVVTFADISAEMSGFQVENLLDELDLELIKQHYGLDDVPSKSKVRLFFSEALASRTVYPVSEALSKRVSMVISWAAAVIGRNGE